MKFKCEISRHQSDSFSLFVISKSVTCPIIAFYVGPVDGEAMLI